MTSGRPGMTSMMFVNEHQHLVEHAAEVAREDAEEDREDERDGSRDDADAERLPGAVDQLREHVVAELGGAEPVLGARRLQRRGCRSRAGSAR